MDGSTPEIAACVDGVRHAHRRLLETVTGLDDDQARSASMLAGWSIGHLVTHICRNADSFTRMFGAAIQGEVSTQYDGGHEGRAAAIEAGAGRAAADLIDDAQASMARLEATYDAMTVEAWSGHGLNAAGELWPCAAMPFHRWREVELHHVDLRLGYTAADWPQDYLRRELAVSLELLPERLDDAGQRSMLAWLVGRSPQPGNITLQPWQSRPDHYLR